MARIDDIERRLQNWARWKHGAGSGGLGYGSGSAWGVGGQGSRYREAVIPTVDCEASETDSAIATLEERLQATLRQVYLTGASAAIDARVLGVSEASVKQRVWDAHRRISNWLHDRRAAAEVHAERGDVARQSSSLHERHAQSVAERERIERLLNPEAD